MGAVTIGYPDDFPETEVQPWIPATSLPAFTSPVAMEPLPDTRPCWDVLPPSRPKTSKQSGRLHRQRRYTSWPTPTVPGMASSPWSSTTSTQLSERSKVEASKRVRSKRSPAPVANRCSPMRTATPYRSLRYSRPRLTEGWDLSSTSRAAVAGTPANDQTTVLDVRPRISVLVSSACATGRSRWCHSTSSLISPAQFRPTGCSPGCCTGEEDCAAIPRPSCRPSSPYQHPLRLPLGGNLSV